MLTSLLFSGIKAFLGITIIISAWLIVQLAWRRVFAITNVEEDVLAGRMRCHGCHCTTPCKGANQNQDH